MYLEKINGPEDIKKLKKEQLQTLADETRNALINKISNVSEHSGPNLGVVELTIAMHYVKDKIVFDVSHQSYPHKTLTGRKQAFMDSNHFGDVTGYTNPLESEHDLFTIEHTSTSVSLALSLAKGRDLKKTNKNVIAIIGDGSLSGGEALEALDYAGKYKNNLIIIVNDNDQSIAENHGGIYKTLKELRENNGESNHNMFKAFGLEYKYLDDGHNIEKLIELFESVKGINHPVVLHIHTIKGKGLSYAEENAVAMSSGIAKNGGTALFGTFAPFFQRIYDQISHDLCLNDNPATMLVLLSGIYGMNTNTHIALCDIQMFAHIPNLIYLAPASKEEYRQMFKFATTQKEHPVAIRVPVVFTQSGVEDTTDYSVYNKNKVEIKGSKVAIFTVGAMLPMALETAKKVKEETGLEITVINPRFLTGLDEELLTKLKENHELVITLEDGELIGGYGQTIASFYGDMNIKVKNYGISKAFHTDFKADELLAENGMSVEQLTAYIKKSVH